MAANDAPLSPLLPTRSNTLRRIAAEKRDDFEHFVAKQPRGTIDQRFVVLGRNVAVDAGLYTFILAKTGASVRARYT